MFLYSSLFLALCTVGMIYQVYHLFDIPINYFYLGFAFCGTICSYNFHWYLTPSAYSGTNKTAWSVRNKKLHAFLCVSSLAGATLLALPLLDRWYWLMATAFITFLYSAPKIPHPAARWLQQIAIGKTLFLAFSWTHVTALLPLLLTGAKLNNEYILYVLNRFLLIYAICILFDYRDRESDRKEGIRSIVTYLEPPEVHWYFWIVLIIFFFSSLVLFITGFNTAETIALAFPGLILAALFPYSLRQKGDYFYYLVLDGLMALSLPLLVLF